MNGVFRPLRATNHSTPPSLDSPRRLGSRLAAATPGTSPPSHRAPESCLVLGSARAGPMISGRNSPSTWYMAGNLAFLTGIRPAFVEERAGATQRIEERYLHQVDVVDAWERAGRVIPKIVRQGSHARCHQQGRSAQTRPQSPTRPPENRSPRLADPTIPASPSAEAAADPPAEECSPRFSFV